MSEAAKSSCVSLIGMMGAGKTTVGRLLAKELGWRYFDNDAEIERQVGKTVAQMFHEDGENTFRDWEAKQVEQGVALSEPTVLSVGGGAVMRETTRNHLQQATFVVWLTAPIETLIERVIHRRLARPMIEDDPVSSMKALYEARRPIYSELADLVVDDSGGAEGAVKEIAAAIR